MCASKPYHEYRSTPNKSLDTCSLPVAGGGSQQLALNGRNWASNGNREQPTAISLMPKRGLLVVRMGWNFRLLRKISARFAERLYYSLSAGRRTAITKCAKFDAPSSNCSQRTTQWSAR